MDSGCEACAQFRVSDFMCQDIQFKVFVRNTDIVLFRRERNGDSGMIFTDLTDQILIVADDEECFVQIK